MNKVLLTILGLMVLSVFVSNYYVFYYQKNYDFLVESPCDPNSHTCFVRDCDSEEGCPPNNLSIYRQFHINANDFSKCTDDTCLNQCESGQIKCIEVKCGDSTDDTCSSSTSNQ